MPRMVLIPMLLSLIATSADGDEGIETQVYRVLNERCTECHGKINPTEGLNVLDYDLLTSPKKKYVVGNDLEASQLWLRVGVEKDMPPDDPLSNEEIKVFQEWIKSGAKQPIPPKGQVRQFVSVQDQFQSVRDDLRKYDLQDRRFLRYFSIWHLHNNPTVSSRDLDKFRAALSKLMNSLSWQVDIHLPVPIDEQKTILRVDLRDLGWVEGSIWKRILSFYPYGLTYEVSGNESLRRTFGEVAEWTNSKIPIIRADWFTATAAIPPLYHEVLRLPEDIRDLRARLGVDVERDFDLNRLRRAGFVHSNVSQHNRLVDRHPARFGAYWESYDFKSSTGKGRLIDNPLGPVFPGNEFARYAFVQDGGEVIFNLPNGLQAYLIVDGKGKRIDEAPTEVVEDVNKPQGNSTVVNGLSCMVCHKNGMQKFVDDIAASHSALGEAKLKVQKLYARKAEMDRWLEKDSQRFLRSLREATQPFIEEQPSSELAGSSSSEPIGSIVEYYYREIDATQALCELGLDPDNSDEVKQRFGTDLRRYGLGALANDGVEKREVWSTLEPFSVFQRVSSKLELGKPFRHFDN